MNPQTVKVVGIGVGAAIVGFLIGSFLLTIPTPTVQEIRLDESLVTMNVATRSDEVILIFDETGRSLAMAAADPKISTVDIAVVVTTSTRELILRAVDGGWRASAPKRVELPHEASESSVTSTEEADELPPPGIPPTSTIRTSTSTAPSAQSISAFATAADLNGNAKFSHTMTVTVQDDRGRPVIGAKVTAVAHYPDGDVTYAIKRGSNGTYTLSFKPPGGIPSGATVVADITATVQGLTSTARVSFTIR